MREKERKRERKREREREKEKERENLPGFLFGSGSESVGIDR